MGRKAWEATAASCREGFQVGLHDPVDAAEASIPKEVCYRRWPFFQIGAKRLNGDARADLSAEFEAVGDGLRWVVDAHVDPFHVIMIDARGERIAGDVKGAKRGVIEGRSPSAAGQCHVHLVRDFRREFVKGQRGEEGNARFGSASGDDGQVRMLHRRQFREAVYASAQTIEAACISEVVEHPGMDAELTSLRRTKQSAVLAEDLGGLVGLVGRYVHCVG
jgi:hypothetical protein